MIPDKKLATCCLVYSFLVGISCGEVKATGHDAITAISEIKFPDFVGWSSEQVNGFSLMNSKALEVESFGPAIILLWKQKQYEYLELLWWKTDVALKREMIVACFYAMTEEQGDFRRSTRWPGFEKSILKFNKDEQAARRDEIHFVKENREKIAAVLGRMLAKL